MAEQDPEITQPPHVEGDITPPPAPEVIEARAFVRTSPAARVVQSGSAILHRADAASMYLELGNVELGTRVQLLNLSARPDARWDDGQDLIELDVTGRDPRQRRAALYVDEATCHALDLRAGDVLLLRAADRAGNTSADVTVQVVPASWARHTLRDRQGQRWVDMRGDTLEALDGESQRRRLAVGAVVDGRAPTLLAKHLRLEPSCRFSDEDRALARTLLQSFVVITEVLAAQTLTATDLPCLARSEHLDSATRAALSALLEDPQRLARFDGAWQQDPIEPSGVLGRLDLEAVARSCASVRLVGEGAIEPRSTIEVQNQRSGRVWLIRVGDDRRVDYELAEVHEGDPLLLVPHDDQGEVGAPVELVFDSSRPDGRADSGVPALTHPIRGVLGDD